MENTPIIWAIDFRALEVVLYDWTWVLAFYNGV